jgi:hypothetical protein
VEPSGNRNGQSRITTGNSDASSVRFIRDIPTRAVKLFDLVDVVAGGNGYSSKRNRGIDPTNGQIAYRLRREPEETTVLKSDGQYHRVASMPFIDGVCIPSSRNKSVQLDSAGHAFGDFRISENATWQHIWAGGAMTNPPYPTRIEDIDYAAAPHGVLLLHANAAITFDLDAIRRANPGFKLCRLLAIGANTEPFSATGHPGFVDLSVLVDGGMRYSRREINAYSGAVPIAIPIRDADRFLTLVGTDSGNTISGDFCIFADPRLELLPIESDRSQQEQKVK